MSWNGTLKQEPHEGLTGSLRGLTWFLGMHGRKKGAPEPWDGGRATATALGFLGQLRGAEEV